MLRPYQHIIPIAFCGFILIAANQAPGRANISEQNLSNSSQLAETSLARLAGILEDRLPYPANDKGCPRGVDNIQSDLCAQWKAADAAHRAADWAARSFWLSLVGSALIMYTLYLSIKGTAAAIDAASSNRAWILHEKVKHGSATNVTIDGVFSRNGFVFLPQWKNMGQSPAFLEGGVNERRIVPWDYDIKNYVPNTNPNVDSSNVVPQGGMFSSAQIALNDAETADFMARRTKVIYYSKLEYFDIYTVRRRNIKRVSAVCMTFSYSGGTIDDGNGVGPHILFASESKLDIAT